MALQLALQKKTTETTTAEEKSIPAYSRLGGSGQVQSHAPNECVCGIRRCQRLLGLRRRPRCVQWHQPQNDYGAALEEGAEEDGFAGVARGVVRLGAAHGSD